MLSALFPVLRQARYLALLAGGVVLAVACLFAGVWQVQRFEQKHDSNTELRHNNAQPAVPVAELLSPDRQIGPDEHYRRVTARGRYDVASQVLVRQRQVDNQPAFLVLTPLRTDEGPTLLVVRGWTPIGDSATDTPRVAPPPSGEVTVTGRLNASERPSPERVLPAGQIERIDVAALGHRLATPTYGGYVELQSQQPPQQGVHAMPAPDLSNPAGGAFEGQHLAYVVQWFLFAALALAAPPLLAWLEVRRTDVTGQTEPDAGQPNAGEPGEAEAEGRSASRSADLRASDLH